MTATLFHIGPIYITVSGVACALALTAFVFFSRLARGYTKPFHRRHLNAYFLYALPSALICSRAAWCLCNLPAFSGNALAALAVWRGGGVLTAGIIGLIACACIYAVVHGVDRALLLDALTPGMLAMASILRFGANATGKPVTAGMFSGALFSARDAYGIARHAVSRYEGAVLLILLLIFLYRLARAAGERAPGEGFVTSAVAYCALTIPLESLRDGAYARVYDMRLESLLCELALLAIIIVSAIRLRRAGAAIKYALVRALGAACMLALLAHLDFRAYAARSLELNGLWMLVCASACAACIASMRASRVRRERAKSA